MLPEVDLQLNGDEVVLNPSVTDIQVGLQRSWSWDERCWKSGKISNLLATRYKLCSFADGDDFHANSPCLSELSLESEMNFSKLHEAASASRRLQSMEVPWPF